MDSPDSLSSPITSVLTSVVYHLFSISGSSFTSGFVMSIFICFLAESDLYFPSTFHAYMVSCPVLFISIGFPSSYRLPSWFSPPSFITIPFILLYLISPSPFMVTVTGVLYQFCPPCGLLGVTIISGFSMFQSMLLMLIIASAVFPCVCCCFYSEPPYVSFF